MRTEYPSSMKHRLPLFGAEGHAMPPEACRLPLCGAAPWATLVMEPHYPVEHTR